MSKLTSSSARTPGKRLSTRRKEMIGASSNARLLQLQIFLGDIGEAPLPELARPRAERVDGDPRRVHRNDLGDLPFVEELVDDLGDRDVPPQVRRLRQQHGGQ